MNVTFEHIGIALPAILILLVGLLYLAHRLEKVAAVVVEPTPLPPILVPSQWNDEEILLEEPEPELEEMTYLPEEVDLHDLDIGPVGDVTLYGLPIPEEALDWSSAINTLPPDDPTERDTDPMGTRTLLLP